MNEPEDDAACSEASARYDAQEAKNAITAILKRLDALEQNQHELREQIKVVLDAQCKSL